jgi:hypothetical protein
MTKIKSVTPFKHNGRDWELVEGDNGVIIVGMQGAAGKRARGLLRRLPDGSTRHEAGRIPAAALAAAITAAG